MNLRGMLRRPALNQRQSGSEGGACIDAPAPAIGAMQSGYAYSTLPRES